MVSVSGCGYFGEEAVWPVASLQVTPSHDFFSNYIHAGSNPDSRGDKKKPELLQYAERTSSNIDWSVRVHRIEDKKQNTTAFD